MTTSYRWLTLALLLVLASTLGVQRAARAGDAGAILGGIVAGAIVYELLDDDGHHRARYRHNTPYYGSHSYYNTPRYYSPGGRTIVYHDYNYYTPSPRRYYRPPQRGHGLYVAPRGHGRGHGRRYAPPRRYCR